MSRKKTKPSWNEAKIGCCYVCRKSDQDVLKYGEFLTKCDISVHYFCLLFSNDLVQRGKKEDSGILRFCIRDVRELVKLSKDTKCCYCNETHATIFCAHAACKRKFHFICGMKSDMLAQFVDPFVAYCSQHYSIDQPAPHTIRAASMPLSMHIQRYAELSASTTPAMVCMICIEPMPAQFEPTKTICSCCDRGFFHVDCVRQFALSAGYYFSCLMCREREAYRSYVIRMGVFVPDREAAWENSNDVNILNLRLRHSSCNAEVCQNPLGRESRSLSARDKWTLWLCKSCAAHGTHAGCFVDNPTASPSSHGSPVTSNTFTCPICTNTQAKRNVSSTSLQSLSFADQTLFDDYGELNIAYENDDSEDDIISITTDSCSSIRPSESYSVDRKASSDASRCEISPQSKLLHDWFEYLDGRHSRRHRRKMRLRLLLGNDISLEYRIQL